MGKQNNNNSVAASLLCTIGLIIGIIMVLKCLSKKFGIEEYQDEIEKIANQNDLQRQKYPYQNVSQKDSNRQDADYKQTLVKPRELASNYKKIFPDDLLPIDEKSTLWANVNPSIDSGSLEMKNMLAAGTHLGVNTQGSSLKNSNQQLRSEPPNPIMPVSIWHNSTITPDIFRKELEIGECK